MIYSGVNNVLVIVLKSGKKVTFTFPVDTNQEESYNKALIMDKIDPDFVEKYFWVEKTPYAPTYIDNTLNTVTGELNPLAEALEKKIVNIRRYRDTILKKLDLEMIKMLEKEDCDGCKKHLSVVKSYLRDVPALFSEVEFDNGKDVINFDVFDNVFYVVVTNPGSGYSSPPTISIDPPNNHPLYNGFHMKAVSVLEDGRVLDIETTRIGSSYIASPDVTISPPEEGGEQAEAVTSLPENNIDIPPRIIEMIEEGNRLFSTDVN